MRRIRVARGYSQAEVTQRGGFSNGYLGMIETGQRGSNPSRETVLRVATGLRATDAERNEMLRVAGYPSDLDVPPASTFVEAVNTDPVLRADQKRLLIELYASMIH